MRKVNTLCISEEKAVRHYLDLIVTVFKENSEITRYQGGGSWMPIKGVKEKIGWGSKI